MCGVEWIAWKKMKLWSTVLAKLNHAVIETRI